MAVAAPKVVILGAGYGGIVTALGLQKDSKGKELDVTLVNKHDYHYFTTHLHMPAAGTDAPNNARVPLSNVIDTDSIHFIKASVTRIVPEEKSVQLDGTTVPYDYLVVALGGEPETFGIPGLKENAMYIRSINSARLISEHIDYQFAKYKREPHCDHYLTFVVGGAGLTGIEFIGELVDRIPVLCEKFDVNPGSSRSSTWRLLPPPFLALTRHWSTMRSII